MVNPINNFGILFPAAAQAAPAKSNPAAPNERDIILPPEGESYYGVFPGISPMDSEISLTSPVESYRDHRASKKALKKFMEALSSFARLTGKDPSLVMVFYNCSDTWKETPFPRSVLQLLHSLNKTPMVTLQTFGLPFDPLSGETYLDQIMTQLKNKDGAWYDYLVYWAKESRSLGFNYMLRVDQEFNLRESFAWTAWMNGGDEDSVSILETTKDKSGKTVPLRDDKGNVILKGSAEAVGNGLPDGVERVIATQIMIYNLFQQEKANNVTFVWCPNNISRPKVPIRDFWPGPLYADWVGVDGYRDSERMGGYQDVFGGAMRELRSLGKPIIICETASMPDEKKAAYYSSLLGAVQSPRNGIRGMVFFEENKDGQGKDEKNWLLNAPIKTQAQLLAEQLAKLGVPMAAGGGKSGGSSEVLGIIRASATSYRVAGESEYYTLSYGPVTPGPIFESGGKKVAGKNEVVAELEKEQLEWLMSVERWMNSPTREQRTEPRRLQLTYELGKGYSKLWDMMVLNDKYFERAEQLLINTPKDSKFYIQALGILKDMYMRHAEVLPNKAPDGFRLKAKGIADTMITLMGETGGYADKIKLTEAQKLGYKASALTTLGDILLSKGNESFEAAEELYLEAKGLIESDVFKRNAFSRILFTDPDKDIKLTIRIGLARIRAQKSETRNGAVEELAEIAYKTVKMSPRQKIRAKFQLAESLALYATEGNRDIRTMHRIKNAFIIYQELLSTELAYRARTGKETLATSKIFQKAASEIFKKK